MTKHCSYVYKKGSKKDKTCNEICLKNSIFCKKHVSSKNTNSNQTKITFGTAVTTMITAAAAANVANNVNNNTSGNDSSSSTSNLGKYIQLTPSTNSIATETSDIPAFKKDLPSIIEVNKIVSKKIQEDNFREKILALETSVENKTIIMKHFYNMKRLDTNSSEYYKNQIFVDNCLAYPWNNYFNIKNSIGSNDIPTFLNHIKTNLDNSIYGMNTVKNEILNVICKFISNPLGTRNNIALYGKAGIAKSKFIQVLAETLNLPLKTISLGGIKDSSFFLGHGYVYVESGPGKILQNVIDAKISNPIFYFDELDKVSETDNGKDIYSFLCYLTDPTQNTTFTDHYFYGMKFDLSKIFYVFTFNNIEKIDKILLDRLNVIYVDTPNDTEIVYILQNHSIPEILKNIGINKNISIQDDDISFIITFCSKYIDKSVSSGIREYYRILEKIFLEINKELLLGNIVTESSYTLSSQEFHMYFDRIKTQLTGSREIDDRSSYHMYI